MGLESGTAKVIRVEDTEANFTGTKLTNGMCGQTSDTKKHVKKGLSSGVYDFTSNDNEQVLLADTKPITAAKQFNEDQTLLKNQIMSSTSWKITGSTGHTVGADTTIADLTLKNTIGKTVIDASSVVEIKKSTTLIASVDTDGLLMETGKDIFLDSKTTGGTIAGDGVGGLDVLAKQNGTITLETTSGSIILKPDGAETGQFTNFGLLMSADRPITLSPATTAFTSLNMPHGTAPSVPTNGDMWTTTAGLYVRINGSTVGPLS